MPRVTCVASFRVALLIAVALATLAPGAWAGPKEEVVAAMDAWAETFAAESPDRILALYDREAVLWGTLSPTRRDNPDAIRDYFVKAFPALPERKVVFKDPLVRVYDDVAINTGYYTFSWVKDGQPKSLPARYSFTYLKRDGRWTVVDHHSSAMPDPNLLR
jgi:uncharacterized protein (TIGR02246 family)